MDPIQINVLCEVEKAFVTGQYLQTSLIIKTSKNGSKETAFREERNAGRRERGVKEKRLILFLLQGDAGSSKTESLQVVCQPTHSELLCAVSCFKFEGSLHTQK